jgi:hypothetical protein
LLDGIAFRTDGDLVSAQDPGVIPISASTADDSGLEVLEKRDAYRDPVDHLDARERRANVVLNFSDLGATSAILDVLGFQDICQGRIGAFEC